MFHQPLPPPVLSVFQAARMIAIAQQATKIEPIHVALAISHGGTSPERVDRDGPDLALSEETKAKLSSAIRKAGSRRALSVEFL